ncbi:hypothetical protein ABDJ41_14145 [Pedobacter sp. ASV1-7]|uniref:hypothetical protein n=1 Tax=Pedobacter sp. ASV1-7 TaxID=3145237 RepID=UPI0032E89192
MKKATYQIISITFLSILLILGLNQYSYKRNHSKNGFVRLFPPHALGENYKLSLPSDNYYLAGIYNDIIYIGNATDVGEVLALDFKLTSINKMTLPIPDHKRLAWKAVKNIIRSSFYFRTDIITPSFSYSNLGKNNFEFKNMDQLHFDQISPISPSSIFIRSYDLVLKQNIIEKVSFLPNLIVKKQYKLKKQIDGFFCTDGELQYDPLSAKLMYMYYYRNQFTVLDTNLNVLLDTRTIDTNYKAKLTISNFSTSKEKTTTFSSPAHLINKKSYILDENLYIYSTLKSDNEDYDVFNKYCVIDVYNSNNGNYRYSFYLPKHGNKTLTDFAIADKTIIAVYGQDILTFNLNL